MGYSTSLGDIVGTLGGAAVSFILGGGVPDCGSPLELAHLFDCCFLLSLYLLVRTFVIVKGFVVAASGLQRCLLLWIGL